MPLDPSIPLAVRPFRGPDILAAQESMARMAQERRLAEQDAFEREKFGLARQQLAEQKAAQQAVGEAFQGATQADEQGQPVLNRGELMRQLAAKGQGHLWPTVSAELDKADQASLNTRKTRAEIARLEREEEDQKNAGLSRLGFAVEQAGNTPEAWSWLTQAAKQNHWVTDDELVPYEQAISQDPTKIANVTAALKSYGMKPTATGQAPTGRTREVQTVNEQGQPVIKIVPDVPGEYPARMPAQEPGGSVPVVRVNPRKGTIETIGEVPKGAHFVQEPAPQAAGGGVGGLTPDAIDYTATAYRVLGTRAIPTRIEGPERVRILNKAAEQAKTLGQSPAQAVQKQAAFKADQASLTKMGTMKSAAQAFENKAIGQADIVKSLSDKVRRTQFPLINSAIMAGKTEVLGDRDATLLTNAITTFTSEYAKIMEGATGSAAGSTDSARAAAARLISAKLSKGTLADTLELMKKEMKLTIDGYDAVIGDISERMGAAPAVQAPAQVPTVGGKRDPMGIR